MVTHIIDHPVCDGTDVQAEWTRSCTDVGFFDVPTYTDTGPPFLYGYSEKPPHLVVTYDTLGYGGRILIWNPRCPQGGAQ